MNFYFIILAIIFTTINIYIVYTDFYKKRIPNKYLLFLLILLPFFYIYLHFWWGEGLNIASVGIQFLLSVGVSFLLYYYWIWSAWDAKYLLVLSLYLPMIGIAPFVGNLALITILYLFGYYIYFYARFLFRGKWYISSFWKSISTDKKDTWKVAISKYYANRSVVWRMFRFTLVFLIFFVSVRLIRGYLIEAAQNIEWIHEYLLQYSSYTIFIIGWIFFGILYLFRLLSSYVKTSFSARFFDSKYITYAENIFPFILFILLAWFIFFEYRLNPVEIKNKLFLIFTIYLAIYLVIKVLYYSYKVTFQLSEQDTISLSKLRVGDIVDKSYLVNLFWRQRPLGYREKWEESSDPDGILWKNPAITLQKLSNPIDQETLLLLKKIYKIVNTHHKEQKTPGFEKLEDIKVLRTFAFGGYIFTGFLITYILGDAPIRFLLENVIQLFHIMK